MNIGQKVKVTRSKMQKGDRAGGRYELCTLSSAQPLVPYRDACFKGKVKVKRTCIAPLMKRHLKALMYGSHRVAPANYTIHASTLRTFARWRHLNGRHKFQLATHLSTPEG